MIQTTIIQLDNYGPWTVAPKPRLESSILSFQSEAYAFLANSFAMYDALTLDFRHDNFFVPSNGLNVEQHRKIQTAFNDRYAVSISMAISRSNDPYLAQVQATKLLHQTGSAQNPNRLEKLVFDFPESSVEEGLLQIAHFDLNDITTTHTDSQSAYDVHQYILHSQDALTQKLLYLNGNKTMLFFIGGDNFVSVLNHKSRNFFMDVIQDLAREGYDFKVGIGTDYRSLLAMDKANRSLEKIRNRKCVDKVYMIE